MKDDEVRPVASRLTLSQDNDDDQATTSVTAPAHDGERPARMKDDEVRPVASKSTIPQILVRGSDTTVKAASRSREDEYLCGEDVANARQREDEEAPSSVGEELPSVSDAGETVRAGPRSGHRRERAVHRIKQAGVETSTQRISLGRQTAKKRHREVMKIRLGKASRRAPRGGVPGGEANSDGLVQQGELSSDEGSSDDEGNRVLGTLLRQTVSGTEGTGNPSVSSDVNSGV